MKLFQHKIEQAILGICLATITFLIYEKLQAPTIVLESETEYEQQTFKHRVQDSKPKLSISNIARTDESDHDGIGDSDFQPVGVFKSEYNATLNSEPAVNRDLIKLKEILMLDDSKFEGLQEIIKTHLYEQQQLDDMNNQLNSTFGSNLPPEDISNLRDERQYALLELEDSLKNFLSSNELEILKEQEAIAIREYRELSLNDIANFASNNLPNISHEQKLKLKSVVKHISHQRDATYPLGITLVQESLAPESFSLPDDEVVYKEMKSELRNIFTSEQLKMFEKSQYFKD